MSSKHKQSHARKKRKSEKCKIIQKKRRPYRRPYIYSAFYPNVSQYKKEQPPQIEEANIKMCFKLLEKDIKFYEEFRKKYTKGKWVDNLRNQIYKDCSIIEEQLKKFNLPPKKLDELKENYKAHKSELKKIGLYED